MQADQQTKAKSNTEENRIFTTEFLNIVIADLSMRICSFMQAALIPLFVLEQGYSTTIAGLTTSIFMLMSILSRPASGNLVDTKGRYIVMLIGSVVYCVATGLYLFMVPIWLLLVVRALQGFGFSFNGTALMTLATDIIPENRMSEGIGYMGLTQTIARAFAPAIGLAIKDAYGFHVALVVVFGFTILNLLSRFTLKTVDKHPSTIQKDKPALSAIIANSGQSNASRKRIIDKDAWKPSILMVFVVFAASSITTFLLGYTTKRGIVNPGLFFIASSFAIAAARLTVGKIHNKFGVAAVLVPGITLMFASFLGIYAASNLSFLLLSGACYGLGIGMVIPEVNTLAVLAASKENRGLANSTVFMAMDLGMALGAFSLGVLANFTGLRSVYLVCALVTLLALFVYFLMRKQGLLVDDMQ